MFRRLCQASFGVVLLIPLLAGPSLAQESDEGIRQEIEALKKGQQDIQKQLEEIKKLLKSRPAAPARKSGPDVKDVVFNLSNSVSKGDTAAKLTLIEFTDYQ